jgi:hypothetical protein
MHAQIRDPRLAGKRQWREHGVSGRAHLDTVLDGSSRAATTPPPSAAQGRRSLSRADDLATHQVPAAQVDGVAAQLCPPERGSVTRSNGRFAGRLDFSYCVLAGQIAAARRAALRQQNYSYACGVVMRQVPAARADKVVARLGTHDAVLGK